MTRPPMGALNPTKTDDTTDAWDTVDWLVKNISESNHRVGMIGSSYDGWTVTMALLGPHPALKVAAPESPMIDGWMGDDWFHYGAFRQVNLDYFTEQTSETGKGDSVPRWSADDYQNFLEAGSAGNWAIRNGFQQLGFWTRLSTHPAYDAFWQGQTYVPNIFFAQPKDYQKATVSVEHGSFGASAVLLPVVPAPTAIQ
jgi:predicted acyl esterase